MLPRRNALFRGSPLKRHSIIGGPLQWRRLQSTTAPRDIAVLGGGITGLATAYYITRDLPDAKVTMYESASRLGGWLRSSAVDVPGGKVIFEHGPRTFRPQGLPAVIPHLIQDLGLINEVLFTSKEAPSSKNRYIYYPDHPVRVPNDLSTAFGTIFEPLFQKAIFGVLREIFVDQREDSLKDESIGSFLERRTNKHVANVASAALHGIYAGDVYQLSMKSIMPLLWHLEKEHSSIAEAIGPMRAHEGAMVPAGILDMVQEFQKVPLDTEFLNQLNNSSVYTFKGGIQQLTIGLEKVLRANENVTIRENTPVESLSMELDMRKVKVTTSADKAETRHDHVVSMLNAKTLASLCEHKSEPDGHKSLVSHLKEIHSVTVMVVSLFFENPKILPIEGFGYLIPRHIPFEQNPERALGVVFDSDAVYGQDTAKGTKVTIMIGGHWWDGWSSYPSEKEGLEMARTVLARHLGITDDPVASMVTLQKDCIPQYTVGHVERLNSIHGELLTKFKGRLRVGGSSFGGIAMNDCVINAREVSKGLTGNPDGFTTGLERYKRDVEYVWVKPQRQETSPEE